jgi:signal transduction histidine kinase
MSTSALPYAGASRRVKTRMGALVDLTRSRLGPSYFHWLVVATGFFVAAISTPYQNLTQLPFWTHGFESWWYVFVFAGLAAVAAPFVLILLLLPRHAALSAYLRGEEVDPVLVWRDCVTRLPGSAAVVSTAWSGFTIGIGLVFVGRREDFTALTYVGAYASEILVTIGVAAFYLILYEMALLPIAREVASRLPPDFAEQARLTGRRRLVVLNTGITFTVGCQASGLSMGFSQDGRPWIVALVTLGLVSTYVGAQLGLVSSSRSRQVDELLDALDAVAHGDGSVRMVPTSGDEFDGVGRAFNRMVDLLGDRADELRESRARLIEVADATRRHIERDLHDGAQQNLALVSMQVGQLETGCARLRDRPALATRVHAIRSDLSAVVAEMRALAHGIYPASLEAEGLASALRAAARESDVMVTLDVAVTSRWSHAVETAVYFCCWEVLQRAGQAEDEEPSVWIGLAEGSDHAVLELAIVPPPDAAQALDLAVFLQDRLGAVGGRFATSGEGENLVFRGEVPTR